MTALTRRAAIAALALLAAGGAAAADAAKIDAKVNRAITEMIATLPGSAELMEQAKGVLIMPDVIKGGLIVGGTYGEGALRVGGETVDYYSLAAGSIGLQLGLQSTKQALFFMTDAALIQFRNAKGWEVGADAEVTVPGSGLRASLDTTTQRAPIIGVVFGDDGVMAGASFEGAKYTRIAR